MLTRREILTAGLGGLAGLSARSAWSQGEPGAAVVTTSAQINHVLVDAEWIYWTEYADTLKIRKVPKAGGEVVDLVQEPDRDERAFKISYAHLQQIGDTLYWSRQKVGFQSHWSLRRVAKSGGQTSVVLPEDHSVLPLYFQGWRAGGGRIVAIIRDPAPLDLPANTMVAVYEPESRTWGSLLAGRTFSAIYVLAVDENAAYLRGRTRAGATEIGVVALRREPDSYQPLLSRSGQDPDLTEPGCTDGTNIYLWTRRGPRHTLGAMPSAGGQVTSLYNGPVGAGLSTDGENLYWASGKTVRRMPVSGGSAPVNVTGGVFRQSTVADLAMDETSLYVVKQVSGGRFAIVRVPK